MRFWVRGKFSVHPPDRIARKLISESGLAFDRQAFGATDLVLGKTPFPEMKKLHVTFLLLERLEHIQADSIWAHRASGVRGSLLRIVQQLEDGQELEGLEFEQLISHGFQILEKAAREKTLGSATRKKESS